MSRPTPLPHPPLEMPEGRMAAGLSQRQLDDALAAEYVTGVLDADERTEAEARLQSEPGFAALVAGWQALLSPDDTPDPSVPHPVKGHADAAPKAEDGPRQGPGLRETIQFLAGAWLAAILVLVTIAFVTPPRPGLIATLATPDNRLSYEIAEYGAALKVTRVAGFGAASGMVHELWLIAPGQGPVSLGLLAEATQVIDHPKPTPGSQLAISLEPESGTLGGRPSGPMILMGLVEN